MTLAAPCSIDRLAAEFEDRVPRSTVFAVIHRCVEDLSGVPSPAKGVTAADRASCGSVARNPTRGLLDSLLAVTSGLQLDETLRNRVFGRLYVAEKSDGQVFTEDDEALLGSWRARRVSRPGRRSQAAAFMAVALSSGTGGLRVLQLPDTCVARTADREVSINRGHPLCRPRRAADPEARRGPSRRPSRNETSAVAPPGRSPAWTVCPSTGSAAL